MSEQHSPSISSRLFDGEKVYVVSHAPGSLAGTREMVVHQADGLTWAITTNGSFGDHGTVLYRVMSQALAAVGAWPGYDLSPDLP